MGAVYIDCFVKNLRSGVTNQTKLITYKANGSGADLSWDAINAHDLCPNFPTACKYAGFKTLSLIEPSGSDYPPDSWIKQIGINVENENVNNITEPNIRLVIPNDAALNEDLYEITFPNVVPGGRIVVKKYDTSIGFVFYKNNQYIGLYDVQCYRNWDTQWGYLRCIISYVAFPCINSDKTAICIPIYNAFVNYPNMYGQTGVDGTPKILRCGLDLRAQWNVNTWNSFFGTEDPTGEIDDDNPYYDGGTSTESDSEGNFSEDSDDVELDMLPTIDAIGTGFATIFTPDKGQLAKLADVMWDSNIFTALQNLVENIQDMFTSLAIVPFEVTKGPSVEVTWLGLPTGNIVLTLAAAQYYEFNMGSINLADDTRIFTSGSALDYSPFSKLGIFLPFIGFQELDIDECRDSTMNLKYRIDILSGTCVAIISLNGNAIYQFSGNCLSQIPITNENMQSLVTDAVNVGIAAAATHSAQGAASADMAAAESTKDTKAREAKMAHAEAHVASSQGRLASATANAAMGMKPSFGKAGAISASASLLSVKQPYLFLTTPRQSIPNHYQRYCGFPSNISGKLNTFSGFTVVEDIRLNGLVATSPEVSEIYQLLKNGVII